MTPNSNIHMLDEAIMRPMSRPSRVFIFAVFISALVFVIGLGAWGYQISSGLAVSGLKNPIGWGVYITDFVFWVGIAHSGTLISAFLFLFRAKFRVRFSRAAEAMTVIALLAATLFPLVHLGRAWVAFWLLPYPNQRLLWPNLRSPLVWDVFAVNAYMIVSIIFFYVGMIPDLAIVKQNTTGLRQRIYSALSLGWTGTAYQWSLYHKLYRLLALFAAPLVICVSGVVSWDFAMSVIPGWHSTVFPFYFVAGALLSGLALVLTLVIPMREILGLKQIISIDHFEQLTKLLIFTSLIVMLIYGLETGMAFYSGNVFEQSQFIFRATGAYKHLYWLMLICNTIVPLTLFARRLRRNLSYLFIASIFINIGMWCERFTIVVMSTSHDFNPYIWRTYSPTIIEFLITLGTFGMFAMLFLLFTKFLPVLAVTEIKHMDTAASHAVTPRLEFIAAIGAVVGAVAGLVLSYATAVSWPIITGGKPIFSIMQYGIICIELALLFGALFSFAGFLALGRFSVFVFSKEGA